MKRFFSVVVTIVIVAFASLSGCAEPSGSEVPVASATQEITATYVAGDASLRVVGYGDWTSPDVDFIFDYRAGAHSQEIALSFQQWSTSGDAALVELLAHMDPALRASALNTLRGAQAQDTDGDAVFNHLVTRILSSDVSHDHSVDELSPQNYQGKLCYCEYCRVHHTPECWTVISD